MRMFVYGSLMRGMHNAPVLRGAEFLGEAITLADDFRMIDMGSYPGTFRGVEGEGSTIIGELYEAPAVVVERLDRLEGHPNFYRREEVAVVIDDGSEAPVAAWMYLLVRVDSSCPLVDSGDWRTHRANRNPERPLGAAQEAR